MGKRNLNMNIDYALRSLRILPCHVGVTCRYYLTETSKVLNWGKTVFKIF